MENNQYDLRLRDECIKGFVDLYNTIADESPEALIDMQGYLVSATKRFLLGFILDD